MTHRVKFDKPSMGVMKDLLHSVRVFAELTRQKHRESGNVDMESLFEHLSDRIADVNSDLDSHFEDLFKQEEEDEKRIADGRIVEVLLEHEND